MDPSVVVLTLSRDSPVMVFLMECEPLEIHEAPKKGSFNVLRWFQMNYIFPSQERQTISKAYEGESPQMALAISVCVFPSIFRHLGLLY